MDEKIIVFDNFEFSYTNKPIIVNDVVQIASKFRLYEKFGPMLLTDDIYKELKKLPTLIYVDNVDDSNPDKHIYINVKTSKTSAPIKQAFPAELFKAVKVPKQYDVINWICDVNPVVSFPPSWVFFKTELTTISMYLIKILYNYPQLLREANRLMNHIYEQHDYQDILVYYKKIIRLNKLQSTSLYTKFNGRTARYEFVQICKNLNNFWTDEDAKALYALNNQQRSFVSQNIQFISNSDRVKLYNNPKLALINMKQNKETFLQEAERFDEMLLQIHKNRIKNDKRFIEELNQDVIDELELMIFDVCTIKKLNSVLFTFIDKNNSKVFHLAPFEYEFYASCKTQIIDNDYIVNREENIHTKYRITDYRDLQAMKYQINNNHDRFMKNGGL